jgi:hypothetical protein
MFWQVPESNCFSIPAIYHPARHQFNPLSFHRAATAEIEAGTSLACPFGFITSQTKGDPPVALIAP